MSNNFRKCPKLKQEEFKTAFHRVPNAFHLFQEIACYDYNIKAAFKLSDVISHAHSSLGKLLCVKTWEMTSGFAD
jgi:hypothetical protein